MRSRMYAAAVSRNSINKCFIIKISQLRRYKAMQQPKTPTKDQIYVWSLISVLYKCSQFIQLKQYNNILVAHHRLQLLRNFRIFLKFFVGYCLPFFRQCRRRRIV